MLGRVIAGTCGTTIDSGESVAGVRIYLEDGRYAVTDDEGKYHFEGLTPGSHVVQLDAITLPEELAPVSCDTRVRSAALRYVAVVTSGAAGGTLVNRATARAGDGSRSNTASAVILLRE